MALVSASDEALEPDVGFIGSSVSQPNPPLSPVGEGSDSSLHPVTAPLGLQPGDRIVVLSEAQSTVAPDLPAAPANGMDDYVRLQRRLLVATLLVSVVAVLVTALLFDAATAFSLLVGACAGMLYLRLLARSVARIGGESRRLGKSQLLVPVVLVLASSRLPVLEIVPALVGFLLYKPALLLQAIFQP